MTNETTTLDEHIEKMKGSLLSSAREQVDGFDLQKLHSAKFSAIGYDGKQNECYLSTMPLDTFLNAIDSLQGLATENEITEENVGRALNNTGVSMSSARIGCAIKEGRRDVETEAHHRTREPQERINIALDRVITRILDIGDNYLIRVFLPEEKTYEDFCKEIRANLPEGMTMKTTPCVEQEGNVTYYGLTYNEHVPATQQFKIFKGFGDIQHYESLPKNQVSIRWHGLAMATTPAIKMIARIIQEQGYEAHFDAEQCSNVLGGVFYKPTKKNEGKQ